MPLHQLAHDGRGRRVVGDDHLPLLAGHRLGEQVREHVAEEPGALVRRDDDGGTKGAHPPRPRPAAVATARYERAGSTCLSAYAGSPAEARLEGSRHDGCRAHLLGCGKRRTEDDRQRLVAALAQQLGDRPPGFLGADGRIEEPEHPLLPGLALRGLSRSHAIREQRLGHLCHGRLEGQLDEERDLGAPDLAEATDPAQHRAPEDAVDAVEDAEVPDERADPVGGRQPRVSISSARWGSGRPSGSTKQGRG